MTPERILAAMGVGCLEISEDELVRSLRLRVQLGADVAGEAFQELLEEGIVSFQPTQLRGR